MTPAVHLFLEEECDFLISFGCSATINAAKCINIFSTLNQNKGYFAQKHLKVSSPHLSIPTVESSGVEATGFAHASYNSEVRLIKSDLLVPSYIILDGSLSGGIPQKQRGASVFSTVCQGVESLWSINSTEESRQCALEGLSDLISFLAADLSNPSNFSDEANKDVIKAAHEIGKSVNLAGLATSYSLSYGVAHMGSIAPDRIAPFILPEVWDYILANPDQIVDERGIDFLNAIMQELSIVFGGNNPQEFIRNQAILMKLVKPAIAESELNKIVKYSQISLFQNNPVAIPDKDAKIIIRKSFDVICKTKELQSATLNILLDLDKICKEHRIKYYLGEGTLLGAIRHKGFIPWDDDVDILMLREDFERFIQLMKHYPQENYVVHYMGTVENYWTFPAKFRLKGPHQFCTPRISHIVDDTGPYVDIFPLDSVPKLNSFGQTIQGKKLSFYRRALFYKTKFSSYLPRHKWLFKSFCSLVSVDWLHKSVQRNMTKYNHKKNNKYMVNLASFYSHDRQTVPKEVYGEPIFAEFEGHTFPVPAQSHELLSTVYGDYMALPPEDERSAGHFFHANKEFVDEDALPKEPVLCDRDPIISVIVPVYNSEKYLAKCIDSLIRQTFQDIEIILVNDMTPDNSQDIVDKYSRLYPNKVIGIKHENNKGVSAARNTGMRHARGQYLAFVDSDDFIEDTMYEKLYNSAIATDADIAACRFRYLNKNRFKVTPMTNMDVAQSLAENHDILAKARVYVWNKLLKRELFTQNGIEFPTDQTICEDSAIMYNLILLANRVSFVDECLYNYRIDNPTSAIKTYDESIFDVFASCDKIINFYKSKGVFEEYLEVITDRCLLHIFIRTQSFNRIPKRLIRDYLSRTHEYLDANLPEWRNVYMKNSGGYVKRTLRFIKTKKNLAIIYYHIPRPVKIFAVKSLKSFRRKRNVATKYSISLNKLKVLQQEQLKILRAIDEFCKEHSINYFLGEGTLLGAIRHGGFVPWDDDLDILMMRDDYERFIELFRSEEVSGYSLYNHTVAHRYHLPFAKIVTHADTGFVNTEPSFCDNMRGLYVDIFPLDTAPAADAVKTKKRIRRYRDIMLRKANYPAKMGLKWWIINLLKWAYSYKFLHRKIRELSTQHNETSRDSIVNYASSYGIEKQTFPAEYFQQVRMAQFEDGEYPIPVQAEEVLSIIYGDYMRWPSPYKRASRHFLKDVDLSDVIPE